MVRSTDAAGNRATSADSSGTMTYAYTPAGQLAQVKNGSTLVAAYTLDAMGRVTDQKEYNSAGTSVVYEKTATYDAIGNVQTDQVTTVRGSDTYVQNDTYSYVSSDGGTGGNLYDGPNGSYQGGMVTDQASSTYKDNVFQVSSDLKTQYVWIDQPELSETLYTPNTAAPSTVYNTNYSYNFNNVLSGSYISDGSPREISYVTNFQDQILDSTTTTQSGGAMNAPDTEYYFFNGQQIGMVSNNGTTDVNYAASIAQQTATPGSGFFTGGATTGTSYASFGTALQGINGLGNQTMTAPSYTVQPGDTLASIAQTLWGDSSYWYLLADANGLAANAQLSTGEVLNVPSVVAPSQNNATTNTVYNPNQALGNITPDHAPPPPHHGNGCGVFGEILQAIVTVVVSYYIGAVPGDIVGQLFGLATGNQSKFNWNEVGMSAVSAAVQIALPGVTTGIGILDTVANAAIDNTVSQGIELATGLEKKFDWAGVAAAAATAGAMSELQQNFQFETPAAASLPNAPISLGDLGSASANRFGNNVVSGMAGVLAGAATRSLITGTDFGDNIMRVLPNALAQTIGNAIASDETPTTFSADNGDTIQVAPPSSPPQPATVAANLDAAGVVAPETLDLPPVDLSQFNFTWPSVNLNNDGSNDAVSSAPSSTVGNTANGGTDSSGIENIYMTKGVYLSSDGTYRYSDGNGTTLQWNEVTQTWQNGQGIETVVVTGYRTDESGDPQYAQIATDWMSGALRFRKTTSDAGRAFIKAWEGYNDKPKGDISHNPTFGYGHKMLNNDPLYAELPLKTTPDEKSELADEAFYSDLIDHENIVYRKLGVDVVAKLSQNQFDAVVAATYNGGLTDSLVADLQAGKFDDASNDFNAYYTRDKITGQMNFSQGLYNRNQAEMNVFVNAVYKGP